MANEQNKTLEALQYSLRMEIDGKKFYLKSSRESGNELGKILLKSLASEEDIHRKKFEQIYEALRQKNDWPEITYRPDGGRALRTIFARALESRSTPAQDQGTPGELEAVQTAMGMENKTYDYYKDNAAHAAFDGEKQFYESLAMQEREHYLVLVDYLEYLKEPAAWFVKKEHPSLDGG